MNLGEPFYHCTHCKKVDYSLSKVLFVESKGNKGFCSETCIEDYYSPLVKHLEGLEKKRRNDLGKEWEECLLYLSDVQALEETINNPGEVWALENDLGEKIYSFISRQVDKKGQNYWIMAICLVYKNRPSFVFINSATKDESLLNEFRIGEKVEDVELFLKKSKENGKEELIIDPVISKEIELKKGIILAKMIEERSPADIPIEEFHNFDKYYKATLEKPDEVYLLKDEERDSLYTYIKAFQNQSTSFYYYVVCLDVNPGFDSSMESVFPVISFPSTDGEIYGNYRRGTLVSGNLKN